MLFNLKKLEATITQYSNTSTSIHYIADNGIVVSTYQASLAQTVVRPTLYLKSEVRIIDGDGTSTNPYIISSDGEIVLPIIDSFSYEMGGYNYSITPGTYPIESYCALDNDSNINNCNWKSEKPRCAKNRKTNSTNTFYLFVKDKKGNIVSKTCEAYIGNTPEKCTDID